MTSISLSKSHFYFLDFEETKILFRIFEEHKINARFVGGCVRDALINIRSTDFDIAINIGIIDLMDIFDIHSIHYIKTGIKYGSITVIINDKNFEITSLRIDLNCLGRDCDTQTTNNFQEDAKRRDFTINAIYVDYDGNIYDYFDGIKDLENQSVNFIGDPKTRIQEDNLRILRYYRFITKFNDISNKYSPILQESSHLIKTLSIERIQKEILKIIEYQNSHTTLKMMMDDNILPQIFDKIFLENFEKLNIFQNNTIPLKLYILFDIDELLKKFHLTREYKKILKLYRSLESEDYRYIYIKYGISIVHDIMKIRYIKYDEPCDFERTFKKIGKFCISFDDLPKSIENPGKKLKITEKWWINHDGTKSKEECLSFILNDKNFE